MGIKIYNRLSQPINIGENILAANGSLELEHSSKDLQRLQNLGHIRIVREKAAASEDTPSMAQDTAAIKATAARRLLRSNIAFTIWEGDMPFLTIRW